MLNNCPKLAIFEVPNMKKTILVTGGSGLIGRHLCQSLLDKGHAVHLLSRKANPNADSRIQSFVWDVEKGLLDESCLEGVNAIIHLAGEGIADKRWTKARKKAIIDSRTESIRLLYKAIQKNPQSSVKHIISAAAIGYYADRGNELLTEDSLPGSGFLAESCIAWEEAVDEGQRLGLKIAKFRTGIVLDPAGGALLQIARPVKFGLGTALGSGKQWVSWIHWKDVVKMYEFALENQLEGTYNMVGPKPAANLELTKAIAKQFKIPLWLPPVPAFVLKLALGEMSAAVLGSTKVSANKIEQAGFRFEFPDLADALKDLYA